MLFVIEHLEPKLSDWLLIEYRHVVQIVGRERSLITNVKKKDELRKLAKITRVESERVQDLFKQKELIVLDPQARKCLSPKDFHGMRAVVIGGILGENPPLGRTKLFLTKFLPKAKSRNLGKHQFAIDGAAYLAKRVFEGERVEEIPIQLGVEIQIDEGYSTYLPYAYPLVSGKPLISEDLIAYLKRNP